MARFTNPVPQYLDGSGNPLISGLLYFFESGTNTPKATYADVNETIANSHPVVLNADGTTPNIFYSGDAKVVAADSDDVQKWSRDPVSTGGTAGSIGDDWDAISIYSINSVVEFNTVFYVSIINSNQNNNPSTTPAAWTEFDLLKRWNTNETYKTGDPVTGSDGVYYTSKIDSNTANNPTTAQASWFSVNQTISNRNFLINADFEINQDAFGGGQPAAGVYGFDMWKGDTLGTRIEQVVENTRTYNEDFTISWVGGTGTADVDGVTGLSSGDTFTLNTSANFSVIAPTDATDIQVEQGSVATPFRTQGSSIGDELALCQRHYQIYLGMLVMCWDSGISALNGGFADLIMSVRMRSVPATVVSNLGGTSPSTVIIQNQALDKVRMVSNTDWVTGEFATFDLSLNSRL